VISHPSSADSFYIAIKAGLGGAKVHLVSGAMDRHDLLLEEDD
jgi:hypothetical protein